MGRSVGRVGCGACVPRAWFGAGAHDSIMSMGTVMSASSRGSGAGIVCGWRWEGVGGVGGVRVHAVAQSEWCGLSLVICSDG